MIEVLPMTEEELRICELAASRYTLRDPSFDDVISRLTPGYHVTEREPDIAEVRRWHRLMHYAVELALLEVRGCPVCGTAIMESYKRFCSRRCAGKGRNQDSLTDELTATIAADYEAGLSLRKLAAKHKITTRTVQRCLEQAGVKLRKHAGRMKRPTCARDGCTKPAQYADNHHKKRGSARYKKFCSKKHAPATQRHRYA